MVLVFTKDCLGAGIVNRNNCVATQQWCTGIATGRIAIGSYDVIVNKGVNVAFLNLEVFAVVKQWLDTALIQFFGDVTMYAGQGFILVVFVFRVAFRRAFPCNLGIYSF